MVKKYIKKNNTSIFFNILKKIKEQKDKYDTNISSLKVFLFFIVGYGLIINYSLSMLFGVEFTLYKFPAFGIIYYFIKDEFLEWIRGIRYKG